MHGVKCCWWQGTGAVVAMWAQHLCQYCRSSSPVQKEERQSTRKGGRSEGMHYRGFSKPKLWEPPVILMIQHQVSGDKKTTCDTLYGEATKAKCIRYSSDNKHPSAAGVCGEGGHAGGPRRAPALHGCGWCHPSLRRGEAGSSARHNQRQRQAAALNCALVKAPKQHRGCRCNVPLPVCMDAEYSAGLSFNVVYCILSISG